MNAIDAKSRAPNDLTENERAWIDFLRLIGKGRDPAPTLRRVQLLRRVLARRQR